tara:strand:- start:82 stop:897 length:816 start_codon:yes stop_codon:yes gene_type:complete
VLNILSNFNKEKNYFKYPFPHIIIDEPIDEKDYNILAEEYKIIENHFSKLEDYKKNNIRLQFSDTEFKKLNLDTPKWQEFIDFHTSISFYKKLVEIFIDDIKKFYPELVSELQELKTFDLNNKDSNKDIRLLCQPGINTPVVKENTFNRGPHIDKPNTIIAGLFYLKKDDDYSKGGDFVINEKSGKISFVPKAEVKEVENVKLNKEVTYKKNKVVFFLNTIDSIHSVSVREKTDHCRRLVNFNLKYYGPKKTFKINYYKKNFFNLFSNFFR